MLVQFILQLHKYHEKRAGVQKKTHILRVHADSLATY